jgi:hypothetical protein
MKWFTERERYLVVCIIACTVAWLWVMPTYGQEVKSAQVKLVSVQMPDSAQKGVPFKMTVSAQVTNSDSPKGGITISFSKPVEIKITSSSASAKVYPKGSKIWNKNLKANMVSKYTMAELWVERWHKEMVHQLSLDVTPLEAGDLDVFIRATATDATSGQDVNAPKEGVLDQQGFPCEKRTLRISLPGGRADTPIPEYPEEGEFEEEGIDVPQAIADFVNAASGNRERLEDLLTAWKLSPVRRDIVGDAVREVDLDGDQQPEILLAVSAHPVVDRSVDHLLIVLYRASGDRYQPSVQEYSKENILIWHVGDVNRDGAIEVITQSCEHGVHTNFLTVDILHWTPEGFESLMAEDDGATMSFAMSSDTATLCDGNGDGVYELVMQGGTIGSAGAGSHQRESIEVFTWDGEAYRLTQTINHLETSRQPFFKVVDGDAALKAGEAWLAAQFYKEAIPKTDEPFDTADSGAVALARFRLLLIYLYLADLKRAKATYQAAQQDDGDYAVWTRAFWEAYQVNGDFKEGCEAARALAGRQPELLEPLTYGYANPLTADLIPPGIEILYDFKLAREAHITFSFRFKGIPRRRF